MDFLNSNRGVHSMPGRTLICTRDFVWVIALPKFTYERLQHYQNLQRPGCSLL